MGFGRRLPVGGGALLAIFLVNRLEEATLNWSDVETCYSARQPFQNSSCCASRHNALNLQPLNQISDYLCKSQLKPGLRFIGMTAKPAHIASLIPPVQALRNDLS